MTLFDAERNAPFTLDWTSPFWPTLSELSIHDICRRQSPRSSCKTLGLSYKRPFWRLIWSKGPTPSSFASAMMHASFVLEVGEDGADASCFFLRGRVMMLLFLVPSMTVAMGQARRYGPFFLSSSRQRC